LIGLGGILWLVAVTGVQLSLAVTAVAISVSLAYGLIVCQVYLSLAFRTGFGHSVLWGAVAGILYQYIAVLSVSVAIEFAVPLAPRHPLRDTLLSILLAVGTHWRLWRKKLTKKQQPGTG